MIRRTALPAVLPAVLLLALGASLTGCGGDSSDPTAGEDTSDGISVSTPTATPTTPPTASPTVTRSPTRTPSPRPSASAPALGNGDPVDDDRPATAGGGVCGDLDSSEISALVRAKVSGSGLGGQPGCLFATPDGRTVAVTVVDRRAVDVGGMDAAKQDAVSGVEGEPENLSGIGSAAFVVTGGMFGGAEIQGAGAVQVGDRIVAVGFTHADARGRTKVRATVVALLTRIARELR